MAGIGTGSSKQGPLSSPHPLLRSFPECRLALTHLGAMLLSQCMTKALQKNVIQAVEE